MKAGTVAGGLNTLKRDYHKGFTMLLKIVNAIGITKTVSTFVRLIFDNYKLCLKILLSF